MTVTTTPPLALSNLINISVTVAPTAASANSFNQGLFIANSGVIPTYGAGARLQQFSSTTAMLSAGFVVNDPEYIAAQIYFDQTPAPAFIWIGAQNPTALGTITIDGRTVADGVMSSSVNPTHISSATAAFVSGDISSTIIVEGAGAAGAALITTISSVTSGTVAVLAGTCLTTVAAAQTSIGPLGSGYHALDTVTVTQAGASYGTVQIVTVGISGQVLTAQVLSGSQGTGYTVANNLPTVAVSPSTGSGFEVNITAVGESLLQAATACRAANSSWYGLAVYNPVDADNLALAEWADALWQNTRYYAWSADAAIANGTANNLALQLQTLELRVMGIYATTQGGLYPNNIYAAAGLMGVDMGLNTGLANSFFTLAHKQIAGIATELVTQTQYTNIKSAGFSAQAPGLQDSALANAFDARHQAWIAALPKDPAELWDALTAFDGDSRQALFAHCVSLSLNAVFEAYNRKPRALAHADRIAQVVDLDMVAAGWAPTVESYLGRVTKARILGAVREARGERAAQLIDHLKKGEMAEKAQELLVGSGWLPEPLRTLGRTHPVSVEPTPIEPLEPVDEQAGEETALNGGETAIVEDEQQSEDEPVTVAHHAIAAE